MVFFFVPIFARTVTTRATVWYAAALIVSMTVDRANGKFLGTFDTDTNDVLSAYPDLTFFPDGNATTNLSVGVLNSVDGAGNDDPAVFLSANAVFGTSMFPDSVRASTSIRGTAGGVGDWNSGMDFGDVTLLFHSGFADNINFPRGISSQNLQYGGITSSNSETKHGFRTSYRHFSRHDNLRFKSQI